MEIYEPSVMVRVYLDSEKEVYEDSFIPLIKIEELSAETSEKVYRNSYISKEGEKKLKEWRLIFFNYQNIRSSVEYSFNNTEAWLFYLNS